MQGCWLGRGQSSEHCFLQAKFKVEEEGSGHQEQQEEGTGEGKQIKQKQPDLATVAEDDSEPDNAPEGPPLQRAPSPSASHSSTEAISPTKKKDSSAQQHASAFGARAQRAFSSSSNDSGDLGKGLSKKPSSGGYSGLNPTSTRSASRMLSDNPPPTSKKPSGPVSKRDLIANSVLQMDMTTELDTFTADIDCLVDSSDEEDQPAAKGKKESGGEGKAQDQGASEPSGEADSSSQKKKGADEEDEEDDVCCLLSYLVDRHAFVCT